jgi:cytochrome c oxidase cbb3-type subunit 3
VNSRAKTDWELLITIANGALFSPMHGYRGKLTDQQMLDVLSYIRSVATPEFVS